MAVFVKKGFTDRTRLNLNTNCIYYINMVALFAISNVLDPLIRIG